MHMPIDRFCGQMGWLRANYEVIPLGKFVDRVATAPLMRCAAAITVDHVYGGTFKNALPVRRQLGLPATGVVLSKAAEHT